MTVIDPGHAYIVKFYDNEPHGSGIECGQSIQFMKRDSVSHPDGHYPGNVGHYPGTNIQEVLRVLIDRVKYLDKQIACDENKVILNQLRQSLYLLEVRAHKRRGKELFLTPDAVAFMENIPTCERCEHTFCEEHTGGKV